MWRPAEQIGIDQKAVTRWVIAAEAPSSRISSLSENVRKKSVILGQRRTPAGVPIAREGWFGVGCVFFGFLWGFLCCCLLLLCSWDFGGLLFGLFGVLRVWGFVVLVG